MKIAIVGATGLVGRELLKLLENLPIKKLFLFASKKNKIIFKKKEHPVERLTKDSFSNIDPNITFFATSSEIVKEFYRYPKSYIIDLSSHFREDSSVPLIIPEINSHLIKNQRIIASPNCTTTIMLMAIFPLYKKFKIKRIVASTYQAASGGGKKLLDKLKKDTQDHLKGNPTKERPYGFNLFLHDSPLDKKLYSKEEQKMIFETEKILNDKNIKITSNCVRVPTMRSHAIFLNIEFFKRPSLKKAYELLKREKGIKIIDEGEFATPIHANGQREVFCSRLRIDRSQKNTLEMWVVGDQLLKGASLNGYQIAEEILQNWL